METFTQIVKTVLIVDAVAVAVGGGIAVTKEIANKVKNKMNERKNYYKAEIIEPR